jgi:hypothetical protein
MMAPLLNLWKKFRKHVKIYKRYFWLIYFIQSIVYTFNFDMRFRSAILWSSLLSWFLKMYGNHRNCSIYIELTCIAMSLHALSCHYMHCRVITCTAMSLHALSCHYMHCHVITCTVMSLHALSCHYMHCHVITCTAMSLHALSRHYMQCHVITCNVMSLHALDHFTYT